MGMAAHRKPPPPPRKKRLTARNADRHALYERAVQAPALDAAFYARWFEKNTGRKLRVMREDFCGTAVLACHHIKHSRSISTCGSSTTLFVPSFQHFFSEY